VLDENGHLKLTDFGLSFDTAEAKNPELPRVVGTPDYMPPEILTNSDATKSVADWWSLGVIIYEVLVGIRPFGGQTVQEVFENILAHTIEWPEIGYG
jgi:serine/threonine protein kinase